MQMLYAYFKHDGTSTVNKSEKELLFSIQKAYDLYHYLLLLPTELADYAERRIEIARNKKIPTFEDLHPNTKFVDNKLIAMLRENNSLLAYIEHTKLSWKPFSELIKGLYNQLISNEDYKRYMEEKNSSFVADVTFICNMYKNVIAQYLPLYANLEEQSIYWNDEPEFLIGIITKTLKQFKESDGEHAPLMPMYKNEEDEEFSKKLLRKVIINHEDYKKIIEKFSQNWDIERIAFMDIILMEMAIAEVLEFPSIPVKVTMNEYLDLSKYYSTSRSNLFINGILDKIFNSLKEEGKIKKAGRGLIGDLLPDN